MQQRNMNRGKNNLYSNRNNGRVKNPADFMLPGI